MRKEFDMMLIVVVCAVLGVICAVIVNTLYTQGILIDAMIGSSISITDLQFLVFFLWLVAGIIVGVMKN